VKALEALEAILMIMDELVMRDLILGAVSKVAGTALFLQGNPARRLPEDFMCPLDRRALARGSVEVGKPAEHEPGDRFSRRISDGEAIMCFTRHTRRRG
jgi:hypothetical protein